MSHKPSLYTAAGIREILKHVYALEGLFHRGDYGAIGTELGTWRDALKQQLQTKEKWAEFYKELREGRAQ